MDEQQPSCDRCEALRQEARDDIERQMIEICEIFDNRLAEIHLEHDNRMMELHEALSDRLAEIQTEHERGEHAEDTG